MAVTLEEVTLWLAAAVRPLEERLSAGSAEQFLSEIGLPAADVVAQRPGVVAATNQIVAKVAVLTPRIPDLVAAIENQDLDEITRLVEETTPAVTDLVAAVESLADALDTAAGTAGSSAAAVRAFAAELLERLFGYLLSVQVEETAPAAHDLAVLLGIVELTEIAKSGTIPTHLRRVVRFDRLGQLVDDPFGVMADVYGWGTAGFDWDVFSRRLFLLMTATEFAFIETHPGGGPPVLRIALVDVAPTADAIPGLRATTRARVDAGTSIARPISADVSWEAASEGEIEGTAAIELLPPAEFRIVPPSLQLDGEVSIGLKLEDAAGTRTVLLGSAAGIRIEAKSLKAAAGAELGWQLATREATGEFVASTAITDGRFVLDLEGADGFLRALLPEDGVSLDFDVRLVWSSSRGLHIEGGAGPEVELPVDVELGPVRILSIHIGLKASFAGLELETSGGVAARLGPFGVAIDRIGAATTLSMPAGGGNLGTADLRTRFRPPDGIGLSLDAGVVKGGGFLGINEEGTEYAGVLELSMGPMSIKAIGILTTDVPGSGWALLLLVYTEFSAVQLGFGFTLNGVGGIIGLQHGISTSQLQSGLRTGVLDGVLFPANPVANAPTLLNQLRAVFPITPRALTIGPALRIGWSTPPIVTISLALVLQFDDVLGASDADPQLTRIVLLGQLKIRVPPDVRGDVPALLELLTDILGSYEVREESLAVDARLRDSHVAGLPLNGSLVVRARFGANPSFILAVGGFHPRFTDLPPGLPAQERVGIQLAYGIATVRIAGYTAITSNTFQFGAEASLVAAGGGFRVEAHLAFDVLFLFEPVFRFETEFQVGASVKYKSISLLSLKVRGILAGPGRWLVTGHASFSVMFWDVDIDFEVEWGDAPVTEIPSVRVSPLLIAALEAPENWEAQLPVGGEALVTLREPATDDVLAHPLGELSVLQRVVPLGIDIDRVGRSQPSDGNNFDISSVEIGTPGTAGFKSVPPSYREEHFARGEYLDLTEEEKLSTPSFERFRAGISLSTDEYVVGASQISYAPDFETFYIGEPEKRELGVVPGLLLATFAQLGAASYSQLRAGKKLAGDGTLVLQVEAPIFTVADATDLTQVAGQVVASQTVATQASAKAEGETVAVEVAELVAAP
jgi:hypothetical protein